jgi:hypothetical protein
MDPGADKAAQDEIAEENTRRLRAWALRRDAFAKRAEVLRARWVKDLARALSLESIHGPREENLYAEENYRALELLTATGRSDAAGEITTAMEKWLGTRGYSTRTELLLRAFEALPRFKSPDVLDWLRTTFIGREGVIRRMHFRRPGKGLAEERVLVDPIVLALQAMAEHDDAPGSLRRKLVRDLVAAYAPLEARALPDSRAHSFLLWMRVGDAATAATRHFAGEPVDDGGVALSSMPQLADWFRRNRSPGADPWKD